MELDIYQQAWKVDAAQTRVTIATESLSKEVKRSHQEFQSLIFWRDVREAGVSLVLIPFWFAVGSAMSLPWTWYLTVPALIWVAGFILVDRKRHPQCPSESGEPLLFYVKESLTQVEHQIWLLRNVFWWYLLPLCISIMAFFLDVSWQSSGVWWEFVLTAGFLGLFLLVIYGGTYRLNQRAVRKQLEPRRQDLLKLIASLENETNSDDSGDIMDLVSALAEPVRDVGLSPGWEGWAENWDRIIPSWREAGAIILATLVGACCGLYSGLRFQIPEMGPTFFQAVVGAVIPFEIALGWIWWRSWRKQKVSAASDKDPHAPVTNDRLDSPANHPKRRMPKSPAILIIVLIFFISIMAVLSLVAFTASLSGESTLGNANEPRFDDISALGDPEIASIDSWLQEQVDLANYPSLTVAIVRDGNIAYGRSFGLENMRRDKKATLQTQYHVASVTKVFTASLAVAMQEHGLVDLDQPVVKYLPDGVSISTTPEVGATITLRQLASHTSGIPRSIPGRVQSVEGWYDLEPQRLYDHLTNIQLKTKPGTEERYSNLGFGLLGHALERAANKPFHQLIQEMICDPLQLKRTAIQVDDTLNVATGYDASEWRFERTHSFQRRLAASGGLVTTVEDLAAFLSAQMTPGIFSSKMLKQMHTRSSLTNGIEVRTALGWSVEWNSFLGNILTKNGGRSNCSAWIGFSSEYDVGVVAVTNCGGPNVDPIGRWLLERSVPGAHRPVRKYGYAKVAPFTGVFWQSDRPTVRVQEQWSPLLSIDGIPVERIMEFANQEFGEKARKRFAEDLVEVLTKMGHAPEWKVTLELQSSTGEVEQRRIKMNKENRSLARAFAQESE